MSVDVQRRLFNPYHDRRGRFATKGGYGALDPGPPADILDTTAGWEPGGPGIEAWERMRDAEVDSARVYMHQHDWLAEDSVEMMSDEEVVKAATSAQLAAQLHGDPDWTAYVQEHGYPFGDFPSKQPGHEKTDQYIEATAASGLLKAWAGTSSDDSMYSLQMQAAAGREFKLKGVSDYAEQRIAFKTSPTFEGGGEKDWSPASKRAAQKFVRAEYDTTQAQLAAAGVTSVPLYRGVRGQNLGTGLRTVKSNPLSSYSADYETAWRFGSQYGDDPSGIGDVLSATVPASRILSTPFSGTGCLKEREFVVLGGEDKVFSHFVSGQGPDRKGFNDDWVLQSNVEKFAEDEPVDIDADLVNSDWTKQSWDLGVDNLDDLVALLARLGITPEHFMTLPVYTLNVEKLPWLKGLAEVKPVRVDMVERAFFNPNHDRATGRFAPRAGGAPLPDSFGSTQEAERWLKDSYGVDTYGWGTLSSPEGLVVAHGICGAVKDAADAHPEVVGGKTGSLGGIRVTSGGLPGHAIAITHPGFPLAEEKKSWIDVDASRLMKAEADGGVPSKNMGERWIVAKDARGVMTHEMGHVYSASAGGGGHSGGLASAMALSLRNERQKSPSMDEFLASGAFPSVYSRAGPEELFAETFTLAVNAKARATLSASEQTMFSAMVNSYNAQARARGFGRL